MVKLLKILMIIIPFAMLSAQEFEFLIVVSDGDHDQTITIGINPAGTDSFDIGLDILAPPPPPYGAFDARLTFLDVDYFKDVRKNTISQKEFYLSYSHGSGSSIILNWDSSFVNEHGEFIIVDIYTGSLFYLDMSTVNYLDISNHPELSEGLKILLTPSILSEIKDGSSKKSNLPKEIFLFQNYPNPFNGFTRINYSIPFANSVKLYIYDINGVLMRKLTDKVLGAGEYSVLWDGQNDFGIHTGSGMYIYQILVGHVVKAKRLIYLK